MEIDHVFCFVDPQGDWASRLEAVGLSLDAGMHHDGQGTRNRRCAFDGTYLELLWIDDPAEAAAHRLRFDLRATTCPFGVGLRGSLPDKTGWSAYSLPGIDMWIYETAPEQPFVFAFDLDPERVAQIKRRIGAANPGPKKTLAAVRMQLPLEIPAVLAPFVEWRRGPAKLELVVGVQAEITPQLALVAG